MKICFVGSSGGHWEELMCLRQLGDAHDCVYVTETGGQASDYGLRDIHLVPQINRREKHFFWHFLKLCVRAFQILNMEKPDCVITTGALIAFPFCVFAKLSCKKVVYIESFARVNSRSLTGRLVYPIADLFLVQWESMLALYPKAKYVGGIF